MTERVALRHPASGWTALVAQDRGAGLVSFTGPDGWELFAQGPVPPAAPAPGDRFAGAGLTGHLDCLPTIAPDPAGVPGRPDLSTRPLVDHGPIWALPWALVGSGAGPAGPWLRLAVDVPGWGLAVTRTVTVGADHLRLDYDLTNPTDAAVPILWAGHGLLAAPPGSRIRAAGWVPDRHASSIRTHGVQTGTATDRLVALASASGMSVDALPAGSWVKAYSPWPAGGAWLDRVDARVHVEATVSGARLWLGLWLNRGGMPAEEPQRHVALEPTTGDHDVLSECVLRETCWWVPGGSRVSWSMRYTVHRR